MLSREQGTHMFLKSSHRGFRALHRERAARSLFREKHKMIFHLGMNDKVLLAVGEIVDEIASEMVY